MRKTLPALCVLSLLPVGGAAAAEKLPWETQDPPRVIADQFSVELDVFVGSFATTVRVDEDIDNPGTVFSAEKDLGLTDSQVEGIPEITLLPGKRHMIRINGMTVRRHATKTLETDINYGGDLYEIGDVVSSYLDLKFVALSYGYQILKSANYWGALSIGVQAVDFQSNVQARNEPPVEPTSEFVPIPLVGAEFAYAFSDHFGAEVRFQYSKISAEDIEGKYQDGRLSVLWQANPHLAVGLGYRSLTIRAESFDEEDSGLLDLDLKGPVVFVRGSL